MTSNAPWVERLQRKVKELTAEKAKAQKRIEKADVNIYLDEHERELLVSHDACASGFQSEAAIARLDYKIALNRTRIEAGNALVDAIGQDIATLQGQISFLSQSTLEPDPLVLLALRELFDVED